MSETLMIIDAYNFLFSAYFALPNLTHNELPVGAVYGFINILLKHLRSKPDYLVVALDTGKSTFREVLYDAYKANRPPVPGNLTPQFSLLRECIDALNLNSLEVHGFEADDVIASLVKKFQGSDLKIVILSTDKDLMQLVNENVYIVNPIKNKIIGTNEVKEKFGIFPIQIADFLALIGDASDNIPGVPGIGIKTAAKLLNTFGSIDNFKIEEISPSRIRENLLRYSDQLTLSKKLVSLADNIEIKHSLHDIRYNSHSDDKLLPFLQKYGFRNLIPKLIKSVPEKKIHVGSHAHILDRFITSVLYEGKMTIYQDGEYIIFSTQEAQFTTKECPDSITTLLEDLSIKKIFHSGNLALPHPSNESFEDLKIMAYTLNTLNTSLEHLFSEHLKETSPETFPLKMERLYLELVKKMIREKVCTLYYKVDKPLINIVKKIENNGVLLDIEYLNNLSEEISTELQRIEKNIFDIVGERFSLASPKQLSEILFEKMKIPVQKKLKTGLASTDGEVLESLSIQGYRIADELLKWRHNIKLKSAYIDPLINRIESGEHRANRISTTYSTTLTLTGRLSSSNPNLQNIPRDENIRRIFITRKDHTFICADYSQIELRILAHIANVTKLKAALMSGTDLHTLTARQIFKTDNITPELRNRAKAVNFGIVYGITNFGLAKQLSISKEEATLYIAQYFEEYPEIKEYMRATKETARINGYVKTLMNRKCPIRNINSTNYALKSIAERSAINAPIQGTAADIIRKAMIAIAEESELLECMVMQVHDELIFEVEKNMLHKFALNIKTRMEESPQISMHVDLKCGTSLGKLESLQL
ncbi:DNA polymerase I [Neorickettsia helminthoeca str. Oregon]|uniref:DNA polymerase I n=2 Tax=Neorickettsia helminthoeca TaxID=33994 RepID=X5H4G9_9RICK|nr:DNA polymerase I [Neorickettsia helminthoeca str. Oregon]